MYRCHLAGVRFLWKWTIPEDLIIVSSWCGDEVDWLYRMLGRVQNGVYGYSWITASFMHYVLSNTLSNSRRPSHWFGLNIIEIYKLSVSFQIDIWHFCYNMGRVNISVMAILASVKKVCRCRENVESWNQGQNLIESQACVVRLVITTNGNQLMNGLVKGDLILSMSFEICLTEIVS